MTATWARAAPGHAGQRGGECLSAGESGSVVDGFEGRSRARGEESRQSQVAVFL